MSEPNLGTRLHEANIKGALAIVAALPRSKDGVPRYSRNKELAKWQATSWILAQQLLQRPVQRIWRVS